MDVPHRARWTVQMMKDNAMARQVIAETVELAEKIGARIADWERSPQL